jgi:hypothetical protein
MSIEERGPDPKSEVTMEDLAREEEERMRLEREPLRGFDDYPDHQCILLGAGSGPLEGDFDAAE